MAVEANTPLESRIAYRPKEAAAVAGVSLPTFYRWAKMDGFPIVRVNGCTLVPKSAFEAWLNEQIANTT